MGKEPCIESLAGMLLSHIWFSDHSICYLELGKLAPGLAKSNGSIGNPVGEVTVFLGYDWFVKTPRSKVTRQYFHKHQNERDELVTKNIGATIESAFFSERGEEIEILTSTGDILISASSVTGQSDWKVEFNGYKMAD